MQIRSCCLTRVASGAVVDLRALVLELSDGLTAFFRSITALADPAARAPEPAVAAGDLQRPESLAPEHRRDAFARGEPTLDNWLKCHALASFFA